MTVKGKPIIRDEETLTKVATPTPADIPSAQALWERHAPPGWGSLLEASAVTTPTTPQEPSQ